MVLHRVLVEYLFLGGAGEKKRSVREEGRLRATRKKIIILSHM